MSWPLSPLSHPQTNPTSESNSTLAYHQKSSEQEKCFRCTVCDKRFGQLVNLNRHLQKFHSERGPLGDVFNEAGAVTTETSYKFIIPKLGIFCTFLPHQWNCHLFEVHPGTNIVWLVSLDLGWEEMENLFKIELISCVSYMTKG